MRAILSVVTVTVLVSVVACGHREPRDAYYVQGNLRQGQPTNQAETRREEKEARRAAKRRARDERAARRAQNQQQYARQQQAQLAQPVGPITPGTCEASCVHYLQCKGIFGDAQEMQECVGECRNMKLMAQALAGYEQTDCATAIRVVEGSGNSGNSGASADCKGCVWDGGSCIWLSSSDWGAGPYSGAYTSCNAGCCAGH